MLLPVTLSSHLVSKGGVATAKWAELVIVQLAELGTSITGITCKIDEGYVCIFNAL
jgi:hypothetical protein